MPTGCEFYTSDTNLLQFSSAYPPYIFLGKVFAGSGIGALQTSTARNRDGLAPDIPVQVELCNVSCPENTVQVVATGDKRPTSISAYRNPSTGQWNCAFYGLRSGSCTLYFFGLHPGTSSGGSQANLEFYNQDGSKVIYDVRKKPMIARSGVIDNGFYVQVPEGRTYGVLTQVYGVTKSAPYVGRSSQGNRQYVNYSAWGGYTNGQNVGMSSYTRDVEMASSSDFDYEVIRGCRGMIIDVTGL